jgi:hypothetical protein
VIVDNDFNGDPDGLARRPRSATTASTSRGRTAMLEDLYAKLALHAGR